MYVCCREESVAWVFGGRALGFGRMAEEGIQRVKDVCCLREEAEVRERALRSAVVSEMRILSSR